MKKLLSICIFSLLTTLLPAQVSRTINVTAAGTLTNLLTATEKATITDLTLTGDIDATDIFTMRDNMPMLAVLDMENVRIKAYSSYPANEMPQYSFCNISNSTGKASIKTITLSNSITSIGNYAFSWCYNLIGRLTIPNSVTSIGDRAFNSCVGLTSLTLGSGLTTIGSDVFSNSGIKIISSLNTVPPSAGYWSLTGINVAVVIVPASAITAYKAASGWSGFNIVAEKHININVPNVGGMAASIISNGFGPLNSITHLTITGNINNIDINQMRTNMTGLTYIDLSNAIITSNVLPANAFQNRESLTSVILPSNLTGIGDYAFDGCLSLTGDIPLPPSIINIGAYAFQNCKLLTGSLTIPFGVTTINSFSFYGCRNLTGNLTIPNSVTSIGNYAFLDCIGLTGSINIPNSVISIGNGAFSGCNSFNETLNIGSGVTSIGSYSFDDCKRLSGNITIPNNVSSLGTYAFRNCTGFSGTLTLSNTLTSISASAFVGCSQLSGNINIPLSVINIGTSAFDGCKKINEISLGKNLTSIGDNALNGCTSMVKISVPRTIPPTIYANTFGGVNKEACTVVVPIESSLTYQIADFWSSFIFFSEVNFDLISSTNNYNKSKVNVYKSQNEIIVDGTSEGETVTLYALNGKQIQSVISKGERLNLSVDRNTIYFVKTGENTFKVIL